MAPTRKAFATLALGAALLGGTVLGGCSNSMTKEEFRTQLKDEMKKSGSSAIADKDIDCIVDELDKKGFKFRKYGELTAEDTKQLTDATTTCIAKSVGVDPKTLGSIPS